MDAIDYWKLCSEYSVVQAALLICGALPDTLQYEVHTNPRKRPEGFVAVETALCNAIRTGRLEPSAEVYDQDEFGTQSLNLHQTLVHVGDLNRFLIENGTYSAFFDRSAPHTAIGSQPGTRRFPPKLDAAIRAWTAVTGEPERLRGKSPKQALESWLIEHAAELGLLNRNGDPNRSGIEEICKVANWKPEGGATPTPSARVEATAPPLLMLPVPRPPIRLAPPEIVDDLDDEIPF